MISEIAASINGVVFDMDGVIIDTCSLHEESWYKVSEIYNFKWPEKLNFKKNVFGASSIDSAKILFGKDIENADIDTIVEKKNKIYKEFLENRIEDIVIDGFKEFLSSLVSAGFKIALCTSSTSEEAETVLKKLKIYSHFNIILDISKVHNPKPHPEIYLKACSKLNLTNCECIGFEDSVHGITALQSAGIPCVVIGTSVSQKELKDSGLSYCYYSKSFRNINPVLLSQCLNGCSNEYELGVQGWGLI